MGERRYIVKKYRGSYVVWDSESNSPVSSFKYYSDTFAQQKADKYEEEFRNKNVKEDKTRES